jgi:RimJ/RimL family protein N-acetyltransferase
MKCLFKTERLLARPWNPEQDSEAASALYFDPEVMRFLPPRQPLASLEEVRARVERYADPGRGSYALIERASGLLVGNVVLGRIPDGDGNLTDDYQVGWHLRRDRWGQGYATEAGKAALERGFLGLGLSVIHALVDPGNTASARVALRLGMEPQGRTERYYGEELELFRLPRIAAAALGLL